MADTLTKWFDEFKKTHGDVQDEFVAFQAGVTKSAVSMRTRALDAVNSIKKIPNNVKNELLNAIGLLPDISE